MSDILTALLRETGAIGASAIEVDRVDEPAITEFNRRIEKGFNGSMHYLQNYPELRFDPSGLTEPAARTMICVAFNCNVNRKRAGKLPQIASYVLGEDYHRVIRQRLENGLKSLKNRFGGVWRICIDSAPVMERYWVVKSGLATRCLNSMVAVKGYGQKILLAEILTDLPIETLIPEQDRRVVMTVPEQMPELSYICTHCDRCVKACPTGAIQADGAFIAKRCVNYLTIEKRGEWDEEERGVMSSLPAPGSIYGCDICRDVCPMNDVVPESEITEFRPDERLLELTADDILQMGSGEFKRTFGKSAAFRTGLSTLKRNARSPK